MYRKSILFTLVCLAVLTVSTLVSAGPSSPKAPELTAPEPFTPADGPGTVTQDPSVSDLEDVGMTLAEPEPAGLLDPCHAETPCVSGGPISCEGFSQCQESYHCWVWCDGFLQYCSGVDPQWCPQAPPEY